MIPENNTGKGRKKSARKGQLPDNMPDYIQGSLGLQVNFIKPRRVPVINKEISGDNALLKTSPAITTRPATKGLCGPFMIKNASAGTRGIRPFHTSNNSTKFNAFQLREGLFYMTGKAEIAPVIAHDQLCVSGRIGTVAGPAANPSAVKLYLRRQFSDVSVCALVFPLGLGV